MMGRRNEKDDRKPRSHNISKSIPDIGKPQALKATGSPLQAPRVAVLPSKSRPKLPPVSISGAAAVSTQGHGRVARINSPRPGSSPSTSSPTTRTAHTHAQTHARAHTPPPPRPEPKFKVSDLAITRRSVVGDELNDTAGQPNSDESFCLYIVVSIDPTIDVEFWLVMPYGKSGDKDAKLSSEAQLRSSRGRDPRYATYIWNGERAPTLMLSNKYKQGFFAASRFYVASAFEVDFEGAVKAEEALKRELKDVIKKARGVTKLSEKLKMVLKVIKRGDRAEDVKGQVRAGMNMMKARKQRETLED